jgi:hypothetical protein
VDARPTRRALLTGAGVTAAFVALPPRRAAASDVGAWSAPANIGGEAIHAALTHRGYVLFFGRIEGRPGQDRTSYVGTWSHVTGVVARADYSYPREIFCGGMSLLRDGRLYVAGGHNADITTPDNVGVAETDVFDPVTRSWVPQPLLAEKRWYPTQVGMPSGLSYIFGGWETSSRPAQSVEVYDPAARTVRRLPPSANKVLWLYPHMRLMPDGRIAKTGHARTTLFFDPTRNTWTNGPNMLIGDRPSGTSVLLSGGERVLTFGGRPVPGAAPTRTAEILDLSASAPRWRYTRSLTYGRVHANGVVLPDATVVAIGGGVSGSRDGPVRITELYDPATERWRVMASQVAGRMYHSTALLLPDGRVFSAGQAGAHARTVELYSPPYLFQGARPVITGTSASVTPGGSFSISSPSAASIRRVAVVRSGSITHQVNTDQRHHFLAFTVRGTTITARTPENHQVLPGGRYMVFLLDRRGVPSVARWIHVI